MNLLQDIGSAVGVFTELRRARAAGKNIRFQRVYQVPALRLNYWSWTMEDSLFYEKKWLPVRDVFDSFSEDTQRALTFTPKDGEWGDRVRFWQRELRPALDPELYHEAILTLVRWGIQCRRKALAEATA